MGSTFISYSRKQLYFAESLALHLQKEGVETWFDLQNLEVGREWASSLEAGYSKCDRLILIASKASLSSPYVQAEWKKVRRSGKLVIVVLYESLDLPNSLKQMPMFDFRSGFGRKVSSLAKFLNGTSNEFDQIVIRPNFSRTLIAPPIIWSVTLASLATVLLFFSSLLFNMWKPASLSDFSQSEKATSILSLFIPIVFVVAFIVLPIKKLWSHSISKRELKNIGILCMLLLLYPIASILDGVNMFAIVALVLGIGGLFLYGYLINYSASFLRWLQPSPDLQTLRRNVNSTFTRTEIFRRNNGYISTVKAIKVNVLCPQSDEAIGKLIRDTFERCKLICTNKPHETDIFIIVVTNNSSITNIHRSGTIYGEKAIFVLSSPVSEQSLRDDITRYQWVDFRSFEVSILELLAGTLMDRALFMREFSLEVLPKPFGEFQAPEKIMDLREKVVLLTGGVFLGGAFILFSMPWLALLSLMLGGLAAWVVDNIFRRTLDLGGTIFIVLCIIGISSIPSFIGDSMNLAPSVGWAIVTIDLARAEKRWFPLSATVPADPIGMPSTTRRLIFISIFSQLIAGAGISYIQLLFPK